MAKNTGKEAHDHALQALELLYQYHWDRTLVEEVHLQLQQAVENLREHLSKVSCPCGDTEEDVQLYLRLLQEVEWSIQNHNLSPFPEIQETLQSYVIQKADQHRCIKNLLQHRHDWLHDVG